MKQLFKLMKFKIRAIFIFFPHFIFRVTLFKLEMRTIILVNLPRIEISLNSSSLVVSDQPIFSLSFCWYFLIMLLFEM